MTRGQKKNREILSPSELQGLKDEKAELQATVKEIEAGAGVGARQADVSQIKKQIDRIDDAIDERSAPEVRGVAKDKLAKEEQELERRLSEGMPTRDEMRYPTKNPGAVRKHMEWCKRNQANIERFVFIQRTLRPGEPRSIETFRREK